MQLNSLHDVLIEQLADLQSAESQLVVALPKMAQAAHHEQLRTAFQEHLDETRGHVRRLTTRWRSCPSSRRRRPARRWKA
jgi:ferritin-like metal-binding protein YciE